jgi:hypothetical protein
VLTGIGSSGSIGVLEQERYKNSVRMSPVVFLIKTPEEFEFRIFIRVNQIAQVNISQAAAERIYKKYHCRDIILHKS